MVLVVQMELSDIEIGYWHCSAICSGSCTWNLSCRQEAIGPLWLYLTKVSDNIEIVQILFKYISYISYIEYIGLVHLVLALH